jgi:hypothetical protein
VHEVGLLFHALHGARPVRHGHRATPRTRRASAADPGPWRALTDRRAGAGGPRAARRSLGSSSTAAHHRTSRSTVAAQRLPGGRGSASR